MSKIIRLMDRTRIVADWKCPRSRYWGYEYLGRGIVKSGTSLDLFIGLVIHDAMAAIGTFTFEAQAVPIDDIASAAFTQVHDEIIRAAGSVIEPGTPEFANEQGSLTEGLIRGFYKHVWPRLMEQFKIIHVEQEIEYTLGEIDGVEYVFMSRPDLIVEDKSGELVYLEYKSTSSKKEKWIESWNTAVQLHSSIMAAEQTLGRRPSYVQIVGLYKGYESYGKQSSPFCYAYKKSGNPPFSQDQIQYEYKAGFRRFATWELKGGVKTWVESMPELVLANQFPMTPPIMINEELVNAFFKQTLTREAIIYKSGQVGEYDDPVTGIDAVYPQKFDQCQPSFGWNCTFRKLCHGMVADPLKDGFELRTPHHPRELEELS